MIFKFSCEPNSNDLKMKEIIINYVNDALLIVKEKTGKYVTIDKVVFCDEIRSLGLASRKDDKFIISISMKYKADSSALRETVFHEVAHIADYVLFKKWGHGKTWKHIMKQWFNMSPMACASVEKCAEAGIAPRKIKRHKRHLVVCSSCNHNFLLTSVKFKKLSNFACSGVNCRGKQHKLLPTGKIVDING